MEKRVLLAIFLSFLVLYVYQSFLAPKPPVRPAPGAAPAAAGRETPAGGGRGEPAAPVPPAATAREETPAVPAVAPAAAVVGETAERQVTVETTEVRAVFSNRGGVITSWQLKKYKDPAGQVLELVPQGLPAGTTLPLDLQVDDAAVTARLRSALFRFDVPGRVLDVTKRPATLVMEYQDESGLEVRKAVTFSPASYVFELTASVRQGGKTFNPTIEWGPALGDATTAQTSRYMQKPEGILYRSGKVERLAVSTLAKNPVQEADFRFVGVDDQYFICAVLPGRPARVDYEPVPVPVPGKPGTSTDLVDWGVRVAKGATDVRFFVGPKAFDVLQHVDPQFVRVINFGIFSWLAVPLLRALKGINVYVGNYGWSIIILTLLINLVMFPLRHKSVVSMRKMQEIQPEIKAIQNRYSKLKTTDPARQKMNAELMNLYRERGVNPASGCVPMLLTFPVLFAFYSLLSQAIEIRGAPFALWIKDLSAHDPYYVTPIIMGVTMVWQQRITPSTVDPAQQKMMMIMPVVFLVMFLWAPSGLVLYWLISNLAAIGQQYATNRIAGPPVVRAPRPAAERRLKAVGGGKTKAAGDREA